MGNKTCHRLLFIALIGCSVQTQHIVCAFEKINQKSQLAAASIIASKSSPGRKHMSTSSDVCPAARSLDTITNANNNDNAVEEVTTTTNNNAEDRNMKMEIPRGGDMNTAQLMQTLKVLSYFALWYALNVVYNILNKKVLNDIPAPVSIGSIQFGVGALYAYLKWVLKIAPTPKLTPAGKSSIGKVGIYHSAGQLLSMVSLGAGPVSFTHIVKALEPFFSAAVSALVFGKWMKPQVYATLIPVVGGVGYACMKERSFSWLAFNCAMGSNVAFALRAVMSKSAMTNYVGDNLGPSNLFGVVTIYAFLLSIPSALMLEGTKLIPLFQEAVKTSGKTSQELMRAICISGLFHYLNNEVMYLALSNVHPVTLAVGNTMKRVFIIVASVLVFRNPVSKQAAVGSSIGIGGVLLYSLTKQYYEKLDIEANTAGSVVAVKKGGATVSVKTAAGAKKSNKRK